MCTDVSESAGGELATLQTHGTPIPLQFCCLCSSLADAQNMWIKYGGLDMQIKQEMLIPSQKNLWCPHGMKMTLIPSQQTFIYGKLS